MEAPPGPHCFDIAACGVALESMAHTLWNGISIDRTSVDAETSVHLSTLFVSLDEGLFASICSCFSYENMSVNCAELLSGRIRALALLSVSALSDHSFKHTF
jgi:hypothetical protein